MVDEGFASAFDVALRVWKSAPDDVVMMIGTVLGDLDLGADDRFLRRLQVNGKRGRRVEHGEQESLAQKTVHGGPHVVGWP